MPLWRGCSSPHDMCLLDHVPTLITSYRSSSCSSGNCWHWVFTGFDFLLAFITSFLPPSLPGFPSFSDAQTFGTQGCWHTFCTPSCCALLLEVNTTKWHFEELLEISWEQIMDRKCQFFLLPHLLVSYQLQVWVSTKLPKANGSQAVDPSPLSSQQNVASDPLHLSTSGSTLKTLNLKASWESWNKSQSPGELLWKGIHFNTLNNLPPGLILSQMNPGCIGFPAESVSACERCSPQRGINQQECFQEWGPR